MPRLIAYLHSSSESNGFVGVDLAVQFFPIEEPRQKLLNFRYPRRPPNEHHFVYIHLSQARILQYCGDRLGVGVTRKFVSRTHGDRLGTIGLIARHFRYRHTRENELVLLHNDENKKVATTCNPICAAGSPQQRA